MATSSVQHSRLFKAKVLVSLVMAVAYLLVILAIIITPITVQQSSLLNYCGPDKLSLIYLIQSFTWFSLSYLLVYEYQRLLSEASWLNPVFYISNLIVEIGTVILLNQVYKNNAFLISVVSFNIIINTTLLLLYYKTEKRTFGNLRQVEDYLLLKDKKEILQVNFQEKVLDKNDNSYYQFRIELDSTSYKNFKVLKSLEDFNKLELIVLEQANRQSQFFSSQGGDTIPRLNLGLRERTNSFTSTQQADVIAQKIEQIGIIAFIRNLERFCNDVTSNRLLWTPDILQFFTVPSELLPKFETIREQYQNKRQLELQGKIRNSGRRQSYIEGSDTSYFLTDSLVNIDPESQKTHSQVIDSVIADLNQLKKGNYPISIKFLKWQESSVGNYIEFKIRVCFQEGPQNKDALRQSSDKMRDSIDLSCEWVIYKRYSNFVALYDQILPYFKGLDMQPPQLPSTISKRSSSTRNQNLTTRKFQLEKYLCDVILALMDRAPLPLLTFLNLHEQSQLGFTQMQILQNISSINLKQAQVSVTSSSIIVNSQGSPKITYTVELEYPAYKDELHSQATQDLLLTFEEEPLVKLTVYKTYGDFSRFAMFLLFSDEQQVIPMLPNKKENDQKKTSDVLMKQLNNWLNSILKIPRVIRMLGTKNFFTNTTVQRSRENTKLKYPEVVDLGNSAGMTFDKNEENLEQSKQNDVQKSFYESQNENDEEDPFSLKN